MKEFPFDPYDFFGYIASGFVVVIGLELILGVPRLLGSDLKTFDTIVASLGIYIAGQLVAGPSKWILEDVCVKKILKAPSVNLMKQHHGFLKLLFPGYFTPLPNDVIDTINNKLNEKMVGESLFLHIRFDQNIRNDEKLINRLNVFLKKYGFARNLSVACLLFGVFIPCFNGWNLETDHTKYAIIAIITGVMLFYRYLKFFRQYSFELFNSYARNQHEKD